MRICVLTPTFLPLVGGAETVIDCLVREWNRSGHVARVLAQAPRDHPLPSPDEFDYAVRYFARPLSQKGFYLGVLRQLDAWHQESPIDLVNAHMAYPAGYVACRWGGRRNVPVVITCHGGDVSRTSRYRARPWIRRRLKWCLERADKVTAVSAELAESARELTRGREITVLENGVDPQVACEVERPTGESWWHRLEGRPFLLDLKRLHPAKGHDVLLRAYAELRARHASVPALVIAGAGEQEARLQELIAALELGHDALMIGAVHGAAKRWLLQNCLILVHPSRREGMPLVIFEAMACGRPVLAVRSEGVAAQIEHGVTGMLLESGDHEELAAALEIMLAGVDLRAMGREARRRVVERHWERVATTYLETFAAACAEAREGRT